MLFTIIVTVMPHTRFLTLEFCRTIKLFELERTCKSDLVQLPHDEQGHLQLDPVTQSLVQPHLEYWL